MTEFKKLQQKAKLENKDVSNLFGVSQRTVTRWRNDETKAPKHILQILRCYKVFAGLDTA